MNEHSHTLREAVSIISNSRPDVADFWPQIEMEEGSHCFDMRVDGRGRDAALGDGREKLSDHAVGSSAPIREGQDGLEHSAIDW